MPLGNRSRRKDILQPFRIFYSLDLGGLTYEQMAPAMRLFAEQVIPHFK